MSMLGLAMAAAVSCASGRPAAAVTSAEILETKVICREEGRYLGWPTVCRRANGELLVVFSGDRDQHVCPWGKVQLIRSADDGKTWSAPVTIQNGLLDDRDAGLIELGDGTLLLNWFTSTAFYALNLNDESKDPKSRAVRAEYLRHYEKLPRHLVREALGFWTARSTDGGKTWSKPARTPGTLPHGRTELRDGRILAITRRFANEGLFLKDEPGFDQIGHHILCEESSDGGRSWKAIADLQPADGVSLVDLHEPHLVELPDGRLVAQARWHKNPMPGSDGMGLVQTESSDGGKTWSKLTPTKIVGFPPHLLVLKDGRLITVYAKRIAGLCGEYACVSNDGGRTWDVEHEILLEPFVNGDLGYPSSVQLADGSLLTVYYQPPRAGEPTAILMTRWRLR